MRQQPGNGSGYLVFAAASCVSWLPEQSAQPRSGPTSNGAAGARCTQSGLHEVFRRYGPFEA